MARVVTRSQVATRGLSGPSPTLTPPTSPSSSRLSLSAPSSMTKRSPHKITLLSERRCSVSDLGKELSDELAGNKEEEEEEEANHVVSAIVRLNGVGDSKLKEEEETTKKIRPRALFNDKTHLSNHPSREGDCTTSNQQSGTGKSGSRKKCTKTSTKTSTANGLLNGGPSVPRQDKLSKAAEGSHKLTEYFPIRRSSRRPKSVQDKATLEDLQSHLKADKDEHLEVRDFGLKGRGVVALREFRKSDFVVEYAGELVDLGQAKEREHKYACDLATGCYMYYFKHKGKQYCIDATKESGRLGRLVNHSRLMPNLQTKVVVLNDLPRLVLVAKRDVSEGEELLYDYGDRSKESLLAHPWLAT